jgi:hypothetical protein
MEATVKTMTAPVSAGADAGPPGRDTHSALVSCGRVSKQTRGLPNLPFFELGEPPYDRIFVGEE